MASFEDILKLVNEQQTPQPTAPDTTTTPKPQLSKQEASSIVAGVQSNSIGVRDEKEPSFFDKFAEFSRQTDAAIKITEETAPGGKVAGAVTSLLKTLLIDDLFAAATSVETAKRVRLGVASPQEEELSRRGQAALGATGAAIGGGRVGALGGAAIAGPPGAVVGGLFGAGFAGAATFQAMYAKEEGSFGQQIQDTARLKERAKDVGIAGLLGGAASLVFGSPIIARAVKIGRLPKPVRQIEIPGLAAPNRRAIPKSLEVISPKERASAIDRSLRTGIEPEVNQLDLFSTGKVMAERKATHGSTASLTEIFRQGRNVGEMAKAVKEAAIVKFPALNVATQMRDIAGQIIWDSFIIPIRKVAFHSGARLRRFQKEFKTQELEDMTFFIEKTENPFIPGDTPKALVARLSSKAKAAAGEIKQAFTEMREIVNESGYGGQVAFVEDYITHLWLGGDKTKIRSLASRWAKRNPFANERTYRTFVDGMEEAGLQPRTVNAAEILGIYENTSARIVANNRLLAELQRIPTADGIPLVARLSRAPVGYKRVSNDAFRFRGVVKVTTTKPGFVEGTDIPIGTKIIERLDEPMVVHPEIHHLVNFAIEQPFNGNMIRTVQTVNAFAKKALLSASFFHHFALTESAASILGTIQARFLTVPGILQGAYKGRKALNDPIFVDELLDARITLSAPGDVQVSTVRNALQAWETRTRTNPLLKRTINPLLKGARSFNDIWDDVLWDKYFNGLKGITYLELKQHYLQKMPHIPEEQVRLALGEVINNVYGGQNFDKVFGRLTLTPRFRQGLQAIMLAPDWTISNLNIPAQLVSEDQIVRNAGRRIFMGHALFLTITTQMLNYTMTSFSGNPHFTDENDPGHKFDVELPWRNEKGRKLYFKLGKQVREIGGWMENPFIQAGRKAGPLARIISQQAFERESPFGNFPTEFSDEGFQLRGEKPTPEREAELRLRSLAGAFIPISAQTSIRSPLSGVDVRSPIAFGGGLQSPIAIGNEIGLQSPIVFKGNNFAFAFPMVQSTTPFRTIRNFEAAIRDQDTERIVIIAKQAADNNIDPDQMYSIALRNVSRTSRKKEQKALEEEGQ